MNITAAQWRSTTERVLALTEGEFAGLVARLDLPGALLPGPAAHLAVRQQALLDWCRGRPQAARLAELVGEPAPEGVRYRVPAGSPYFVGREDDLHALLELLTHGDALLRTAVEGLPGVGKTELAIQLAQRAGREGRFPGGICWFDAEQGDLTLQWDRLGEQLGVPGPPGPERVQATLRILEGGHARLLLVLDNVSRWDRTAQPAPLPEGEHVRILVTTRHKQLGGTRFRHHSLQFLPQAAAERLLHDLAGRDVPEAAPLLDHLEGHALAVELAGAFLCAYPEVSAAEYLAELQGGTDPSAQVAGRTRYEATVEQALGSLWNRLDDSCRRAWAIAACCAPEPVGLALCEACGLGREARRQLRELHLVDDLGQGRIRMHRLVRDFGLAAGDESARRAFVEGCLARADQIDLATGYQVLAEDQPHLESLVQGGPGWTDARPAEQSLLLDRLGTAFQSAGQYARARQLLEQALASDLCHFEADHPTVAIRHANLATVLRELGDLAGARQLLEQALDHGGDHPTVATFRSNMALVLRDLGDPGEARQLLEQALASDRCTFGKDHPEVAIDRHNLALVLQDLADLPGARQLLEQALDGYLSNFGENHPYVAMTRSMLATVLREFGDLGGAQQLLEQALASFLSNFEESHPKVAMSRSNLARVLEDLGDQVGAQQLLKQARDSILHGLGEDHPDLALHRSNLARVLQDLGDHDHAQVEAREALRIARLQPPGSLVRTRVEQSVRGMLPGEVE